MELVGRLMMCEDQYWVRNTDEAWAWPFEVGSFAEVMVGGAWQAVTMQSGGYRGIYLRFADGGWARPAVSMWVRVAVLG